jgi:hypothetical protein
MLTSRLTVECGGSFRVNVLPEGRVELTLEDANVSSASDTLYDKRGVAARLGTTIRSIENWMVRKKHPLPFLKQCGRTKFRESDVAWWLSQGCSVASRRDGCNI